MYRLVVLLALLLPNVGSAHGVELSVTIYRDAISGSARFADGAPMAEAVVELRHPDRPRDVPAIARSRTNAEGRFALPAPREARELLLSVDDGIGHRGERALSTGSVLLPTTTANDRRWPWREWLSGLGYLVGLLGLASLWFVRRGTSSSRD